MQVQSGVYLQRSNCISAGTGSQVCSTVTRTHTHNTYNTLSRFFTACHLTCKHYCQLSCSRQSHLKKVIKTGSDGVIMKACTQTTTHSMGINTVLCVLSLDLCTTVSHTSLFWDSRNPNSSVSFRLVHTSMTGIKRQTRQ